MKKYLFKASLDKKVEGVTNNFSISSYCDQNLRDFQDTIDYHLHRYNLTRNGKKSGVIFNQLGEELGSYEVYSTIIN